MPKISRRVAWATGVDWCLQKVCTLTDWAVRRWTEWGCWTDLMPRRFKHWYYDLTDDSVLWTRYPERICGTKVFNQLPELENDLFHEVCWLFENAYDRNNPEYTNEQLQKSRDLLHTYLLVKGGLWKRWYCEGCQTFQHLDEPCHCAYDNCDCWKCLSTKPGSYRPGSS